MIKRYTDVRLLHCASAYSSKARLDRALRQKQNRLSDLRQLVVIYKSRPFSPRNCRAVAFPVAQTAYRTDDVLNARPNVPPLSKVIHLDIHPV